MKRRWNYKTCYETMSLLPDPMVPWTAKWGFWMSHAINMRGHFIPNDGYAELRKLVEGRDHFVYTSNGDGMFERAHFDPERIYTPQGDYANYQCMGRHLDGPCSRDSVWPLIPLVNDTVHLIDVETGELPPERVPTCPVCGGHTFPNLRGGPWCVLGFRV